MGLSYFVSCTVPRIAEFKAEGQDHMSYSFLWAKGVTLMLFIGLYLLFVQLHLGLKPTKLAMYKVEASHYEVLHEAVAIPVLVHLEG